MGCHLCPLSCPFFLLFFCTTITQLAHAKVLDKKAHRQTENSNQQQAHWSKEQGEMLDVACPTKMGSNNKDEF